jgi:hypothetical protein
MLYLLGVMLFYTINVMSLEMIPTSRIYSVKLGDRIHVEIKYDIKDGLFADDGKDYQGVDMRNPILSDLNGEEIYNIGVNMKKNKILKTLEDDEVGMPRKLKLIEKMDLLDVSMKSNLLAGGLLDDWNSDIF